ncbi:MAG TPA: dihydroorotase [Acidiferrobacteraceae bacterium]|nr:dihydroorotase [Acidiferrobacteraceae bacterium]
MHTLLIHDCQLALPDGTLAEGDLLCRGGLIERVGGSISTRADEVIDARGHLLLPGAIDPQVHFREPGSEHKETIGSGSRAAAAGGVTSFLEMPNTRPPTTTQAALDDKLARAARSSVVNYGFFVGATPDNVATLEALGPACGIKVFMGSSTGDLLVDRAEDLERIFATGRRLIAVHAEDQACIERGRALRGDRTDPAVHSEIRPAACAVAATQLALELSRRYRRRLHVLHVSTKEEVALLRERPPWVTAEVIPNHLFLNREDYARQGTRVQMNPPIRDRADNEALWAGLHDGALDFVATDHAPHTLEEKAQTYPDSPSGMPGVETMLPMMLTAWKAGRCTLAEVLRWTSGGAAQAYGLRGKGRLEAGMDADLVLVDVTQARILRDADTWTQVRWNPFSGRSITGFPIVTIVGGRVVFDHQGIRPDARGQALQYHTDA